MAERPVVQQFAHLPVRIGTDGSDCHGVEDDSAALAGLPSIEDIHATVSTLGARSVDDGDSTGVDANFRRGCRVGHHVLPFGG